MAVSITIVDKNVVGAQYEVVADITFDSSYPTGGEPLTVGDLFDPAFGKGVVTTLSFITCSAQKTGATRIFAFDYANNKLLAYTAAMGTQVTDTTDLSTAVVRVLARGGRVTG